MQRKHRQTGKEPENNYTQFLLTDQFIVTLYWHHFNTRHRSALSLQDMEISYIKYIIHESISTGKILTHTH